MVYRVAQLSETCWPFVLHWFKPPALSSFLLEKKLADGLETLETITTGYSSILHDHSPPTGVFAWYSSWNCVETAVRAKSSSARRIICRCRYNSWVALSLLHLTPFTHRLPFSFVGHTTSLLGTKIRKEPSRSEEKTLSILGHAIRTKTAHLTHNPSHSAIGLCYLLVHCPSREW